MNSEITEKKEVVLSGIRATGSLHLGNYLGAVKHFVESQRAENLCLYFVADWHSMTTDHSPERLRSEPIQIVKDYLAAGLDPACSIIYVQSSIPELLELTWYLATLQMVPELTSLPTYVEHLERIKKAEENPKNNNLALFEKQPIVLVQSGSASFEEIKEFSKEIMQRVKEKTGIEIELEVQKIQ